MSVKITKEMDGEFVVLTVSAPPIDDRKISISMDALYDGTTDLKEQVKLARKEAKRRLKIYESVSRMTLE